MKAGADGDDVLNIKNLIKLNKQTFY